MSNTIGNNLTLTIFGESHGKMIGATLDGLPSGIKIDEDFIELQMSKRRAKGNISTQRHEEDIPNIISGVFNGYTTGTPLTLLIQNKDTRSVDYEKTKNIPRPGHADYTAKIKYYNFQDYRGGGHFSGRLTAAIVAAGAICMLALREKKIYISTHIKQLYNLYDDDFDFENILDQFEELNNKDFAVLNNKISKKMVEIIDDARLDLDSLGGVLETVVINLPKGLGDPLFNSVEGNIAKALFGIGAIKGVEFGQGFNFANMKGSNSNDPIRVKDKKVISTTNNNGGINGGITNGMPLIVKTVVKPTSSIARKQESIDMETNMNTTLEITGRHDPAIIHRARVVVDCMISIVLLDLIVTRYGQDWSKTICED
ncbi:MAG: chorismate synthase [Erysipelotrichaceae bacterium]|nr:chorismate synthase [Erysipelotrichaceae bacterium]